MREQSNPRGTAGRSDWFNPLSRGRLTGQGTRSIAPQKAKGIAGVPVHTPQRVETPPRSRSPERGDGRDTTPPPLIQPTPMLAQPVEVPIATTETRASSLETNPPRGTPHSEEGLGPIVYGTGDQSPTPSERRSSSTNPIRRVLTAITGRGRSQPHLDEEDHQLERDLHHVMRVGYSDSQTPSSDYSGGYRSGESPEGTPVVIDDDDDDDVFPPREVPQPQGEPEPEYPGGDGPSESAQTGPPDEESDLPDQENDEEEDESPEYTDTDPYGDPTETQADATVTPETEDADVIESADNAQVDAAASDINPEAPAPSHEASLATEAISEVPVLLVEEKKSSEDIPKSSPPPRPEMGRMDAFKGQQTDWFNPLRPATNPMLSSASEKKQAPADSQESNLRETEESTAENPPQSTEGESASATASVEIPSQSEREVSASASASASAQCEHQISNCRYRFSFKFQ